MNISKKGKIVIAGTAVFAAIAVVAMATGFRKNQEEIRRIPVNLNATLTNEMSDTSVLAGKHLQFL